LVRDLQQAARLAAALADQLAGLETYQTHDQLMAQLDGLINNWAATSEMTGSVEQAAQQGINLYYLVPGMVAGAANEGWFEGAA
jgi:fructoselysine-6-P-deglycase FrlB-like protein